jgi:hypothetical protein
MMFSTGPPWPESMFAVRVGVPAAVALEAENEARKAGLSVIHLDLTGVVDDDSMVERLSTTFAFAGTLDEPQTQNAYSYLGDQPTTGVDLLGNRSARCDREPVPGDDRGQSLE